MINLINDTLYTIIDFETTGLDENKEQVIEVAALRTDLERDYGCLNFFVRLETGKILSDYIKDLTKIRENDLSKGMDKFQASAALNDFIGDTIVIAHHAPFDLAFLDKYFGIVPNGFICTRVLSKMVDPNNSARLKYICERYGIYLKNYHRAMSDVRATKEAFKILKAKADKYGFEYRNTVINDNERPLSYISARALVL